MEEKNLINVDPRVKKVLTVVIPLIIACLSFFVAAKWATNVDTYAKTIASLDEKKQNVMELTAASTAASPLPAGTSTVPRSLERMLMAPT